MKPASSMARKPGPASSRVSCWSPWSAGPGWRPQENLGALVLWKSLAGTTPSCPQTVHLPIPPSWGLLVPSFCLWALGFPAEMFFFKTGCNRTLHPALWRGSVGASRRREPCARKPDPHRSLRHGGGSLSLSGLSFSHRAVMWMTSEVVDLELVVASFCQGQSRWESLSGAGPSRPVLNHHLALPYPVLLTLLLSFRMKKAGLDLPLRQFQGTLDLLKCLRPFLVLPPLPQSASLPST